MIFGNSFRIILCVHIFNFSSLLIKDDLVVGLTSGSKDLSF